MARSWFTWTLVRDTRIARLAPCCVALGIAFIALAVGLLGAWREFSEMTTLLLGAPLILALLGIVLLLSLGHQGSLTLTKDALILRRTLPPSLRIPRNGMEVGITPWKHRGKGGTDGSEGIQIQVSGDNGSLAIGCEYLPLEWSFDESPRQPLATQPDVILTQEDFLQMWNELSGDEREITQPPATPVNHDTHTDSANRIPP